MMARLPQVIYVGDPMCSWCWGMAPTLETVSGRSDLEFRVVVGGLRPGVSAQPLDDRLRAVLIQHWDKVAAVSGQPFDRGALDRDGWVYDTELPAIAVVTMRALAPSHTMRFFSRLQRAFYAERIDVTDSAVYPRLVQGFPVDPGSFVAWLTGEQMRTAAWEDFAEARNLGVLGFPSLLLDLDGTTQVLARGYTTAGQVEDLLTHWVEGRQPASANTGSCDVGGSVC